MGLVESGRRDRAVLPSQLRLQAERTDEVNQTIKCPWCTKKVNLSPKGCIKSHLVSTGVRCFGVGARVGDNDPSRFSLTVTKKGRGA